MIANMGRLLNCVLSITNHLSKISAVLPNGVTCYNFEDSTGLRGN